MVAYKLTWWGPIIVVVDTTQPIHFYKCHTIQRDFVRHFEYCESDAENVNSIIQLDLLLHSIRTFTDFVLTNRVDIICWHFMWS